MLNPSELRYGNNIYNPEGQIITVTYQTFTAMHEAEKALKPHGFTGIPLGDVFKKPSVIDINTESVTHAFIIIAPFDGYAQLLTDEDALGSKLTFLHELQNLYYDLQKSDLPLL